MNYILNIQIYSLKSYSIALNSKTILEIDQYLWSPRTALYGTTYANYYRCLAFTVDYRYGLS